MSDDYDGLMLNFAVPEPVSSSTTSTASIPQGGHVKVSGGRWKDRRKLQLSLQGREKPKPKPKGTNSIPIDQERAQKRRFDLPRGEPKDRKPRTHLNDGSNESQSQYKKPRVDRGVGNGSNADKRDQSSQMGKSGKGGKNGKGGKEDSYVSSLFTNNQSAAPVPNGNEEDNTGEAASKKSDKTYAPSNAPVKGAATFNGLGLNDKLVKHLTEYLRYKYPTQIQKQVIPELLTTQRDVFVKAQTGSGKTMAFTLPIFHKLMVEEKHRIGRESGVSAMILAPTRELANQIYSVLENLNRCCPFIVPGIVIGGEKKKSEKARLRKGVNILVGTPGRLKDHLENTKSLDISQIRYLVLDEGDKLVELGFEETITRITQIIEERSLIRETSEKWQGLPTRRINMLCSATLQNNVKKLGSIILDNPEMISVDREVEGTILFDDGEDHNQSGQAGSANNGQHEHESFAPEQLIQNVVVVPPKLRLVSLEANLVNIAKKIKKEATSSRSIVFFSCSDSVNYHFEVFTRDGKAFKKVKDEESGESRRVLVDPEDVAEEGAEVDLSEVTAPLVNDNTIIYKLHGSLPQQTRTNILQNFIKDDPKFPHKVLFCTDVASRGLDLPNISNVIEYDAPFTIDDHLHRIGRSARVGAQGNATLFLTPGLEEGYIDAKLKVVHPRAENLRLVNYEKPLQQAFAEDDGAGSGSKRNKHNKLGNWDVHATTWHLEVERWLLEDSTALAKASQAFTSHIRAYATHLSTERNFFNVKTLHLGHLAKSFGLRETPKSLGKSAGKNNETSHGESARSKLKKEDPRKKMLRMAKMAVNSASSEFNY